MSEEAVHAILDNVYYYNLLQPNRIWGAKLVENVFGFLYPINIYPD